MVLRRIGTRHAPRRLAALALALLALAGAWMAVAASRAEAFLPGSEDAIAGQYHDALLQHTRWVETTWNATNGFYNLVDMDFTSVLGNAVLLKFGSYDATAAGVSAATLQDHTIRTIQHFAATNLWNNANGDWGKRVYFDSTFEQYFVAAAKIMWADLDATTRSRIDAIIRGGANQIVSQGSGNDPLSAGWTTNGLTGGFIGDTKLEEMGARTMPVAAAMAYLPGAAALGGWRTWLDRWMINMDGLPQADTANPTSFDGQTVAQWSQAHNIWDTFLVENHGSFATTYEEASASYPGRDIVQFLINSQGIPSILRNVPNQNELWRALDELGTDAGVPEDFMVADRHHLYGRNVLPLAYRAVVLGDPFSARAEQMLADRLVPYVSFPPGNRLTKFSGEPKYEPEARAEVAMAYLLHYWRANLGGGATPVSSAQYFAGRSGATDYGPDLGMIAQQTPNAVSAAVTHDSFTKFAFVPNHDDWLMDVAGNAPSLLPSVTSDIRTRNAHEYRESRDGFDGTATGVQTASGFAGFTTLPTGAVVYATSGLAANEGPLRVTNLNMPGVPGLDGNRTYTSGSTVLNVGSDNGDGLTDQVIFAPTTARYVRFLGVTRATEFGYSLWDFEVRNAAATNLALGKPATASSNFGAGFEPFRATDGDPNTRWAVSSAGRADDASWLRVDLGSSQTFERVKLRFEDAFASAYKVQVSDDDATWRTVASVPEATTSSANWLNVDNRAGFVKHGGTNPIAISGDRITLSSGPASGAAGLVVEGFPAQTPAQTQALASAPQPSGGPSALRSALTDNHLSLFNLGEAEVAGATVTVPQDASKTLFDGSQTTTAGGSTTYDVPTLDGADAALEAPRFTLSSGGGVPAGLDVEVLDTHTVRITNTGGSATPALDVTSVATSETHQVTVAAGATQTVAFANGLLAPVSSDLARGSITFPSSPLPPGMTDPDNAVDGDPSTTWVPGSNPRMVIDLGGMRQLSSVTLTWSGGTVQPYNIDTSGDGITYATRVKSTDTSLTQTFSLTNAPRYVAINAPGWTSSDARLADISVRGSVDPPPAATGNGGLDEVRFAPTQVRFVRMQGTTTGTGNGYSIFSLEAHLRHGPDVARGKPATASSFYDDVLGVFPPSAAFDGNDATRWAVSIAGRTNDASWVQVDLGAVKTIDRASILWESAFGSAYKVQGSTNGTTWTTLATVS
jgi:hypothetical protein